MRPGSASSSSSSSAVSTSSKMSSSGASTSTVSVLGSGDFGRALAMRFVQAGFDVCVGSREPNRNRALVNAIGARAVSQSEAISSSALLIVATRKDAYTDLPLKYMAGKTVVDVSNRSSVHRKTNESQAEYLQSLLPDAHVVKAFNVLSAYALENGGLQGSKEVLVAGDDLPSKEGVCALIRACGFAPVDLGGLRAARDIEDVPVQRFPEWKLPLLVSLAVFVPLYLLAIAKFQICWTYEYGPGTWHWGLWNQLPLDTFNKTLAVHAICMLVLCYVPGVLAAYLQLIRGTKYSRFPKWLDRWLKMRKQLGLLMLFSASLHACISLAIFSPQYHYLAYGLPTPIKANVVAGNVTAEKVVTLYGSNGKLDWRGEMFLLCGILSFALVVILGLTSLPSVTAILSWKEFSFVQSQLGWASLILACAHDLFYGWYKLDNYGCYLVSSLQYVLYVPALTFVLKMLLLLPCVAQHLKKIRGGWERNKSRRQIHLA